MNRFTFCGETIMSVSELAYDEVLKAPSFDFIQTLYPGIVSLKEIGWVGQGGLVGVKNQGCDPDPQPYGIGTRKKQWNPKAWEVLIHACWTDLESTAAVYSLHVGRNVPDFTDTDYMNIVLNVLVDSLHEFFYRLYWFNALNMQHVADDGILADTYTDQDGNTQPLPIEYFNIIDGFWFLIEDWTSDPANAKQVVTITENAGATYDAQEMIPANAITYFQKMYYDAPLLLRRQKMSGLRFYVTQTVYDAYEQWLMGRDLESTYRILRDGEEVLTWNGIEIVPVPIWDTIIQSYFDNGAAYYKPNRIILANKNIFAAGIDDPNAFDDLNIWYDRDSRRVKIEGMGKSDALVLNDTMYMVGW